MSLGSSLASGEFFVVVFVVVVVVVVVVDLWEAQPCLGDPE